MSDTEHERDAMTSAERNGLHLLLLACHRLIEEGNSPEGIAAAARFFAESLITKS